MFTDIVYNLQLLKYKCKLYGLSMGFINFGFHIQKWQYIKKKNCSSFITV